MPARKNNRILGLMFLYLVACGASISGIIAYRSSIPLSNPTWADGQQSISPFGRSNTDVWQNKKRVTTKLYSAPRNTLQLPINVILGNDAKSKKNSENNDSKNSEENAIITQSTEDAQNTTNTNTTKGIKALSQNAIPCASISMCNKLTFSPEISQTRKARYTADVFSILKQITSHTSQLTPISQGLFSVKITDEIGDRRGRGGSQTIQINTKSMQQRQEFKEIFTHELGHIMDLGILVWSGNTLDTTFTLNGKPQFTTTDISLQFYSISRLDSSTRSSDAGYTDFVGWYAMTSPYEDFAESWNMFLRHNTVFKAMSKDSEQLTTKYRFFEKILSWFSFANDIQNAKKVLSQPSRRPRDTSTILQ
jgi:hypothetical protein